jgi:hypothetical protein
VALTPEPAGSNCPSGGVRIETGIDVNDDGTLEPTEVNATQTQYVCNGIAAGNTDGLDAGAGGTDGTTSGSGGGSGTATGGAGVGGSASGGSGSSAYSHTITIDGEDDFSANEQFATSTPGYSAYFTWDASYLYVGIRGMDIGIGSSTEWVLLYLSGSPGTTLGITYNTQAPLLPFGAHWQISWQATNDLSSRVFDGTQWADAAWDFSGDAFINGAYLEFRVPLSELGFPTKLDVHLSMINEASHVEWTWAAVPSASISDSYNPTYTQYYEFDFSSSTAPNAYEPLP